MKVWSSLLFLESPETGRKDKGSRRRTTGSSRLASEEKRINRDSAGQWLGGSDELEVGNRTVKSLGAPLIFTG